MEKDIRTILSLLADGHVTAEVGLELLAKECGIDYNKLVASLATSLSGKKARKAQAGLTFTRWTPEAEQYVITAWNRGDSIKDIADYLDRTKAAIRGRLSIMQKNGHEVTHRRSATV